MFHRCVVACLLVGYIAGQWAAVPHTHAHEHDDGSGHHGRAHAHIGWLVPAGGLAERALADNHLHGHTHRHTHGHPHSHSSPLPAESGDGDHDNDLVYLPNAVVANIGKVAALDAPLDAAIGPALMSSDCPKVAIRKAALRSVPAAEAFAPCPLFLKLRTLRI